MEGVTANRNQFVEWIVELQSFAQAGLTYEHDSYDLERYSRIREISAEMLANLAELPVEKVQNLFCRETGYQTPKIDTRAAIFDGDRILLVRESNGEWALPGGWCDVNQSIAENTIKEARGSGTGRYRRSPDRRAGSQSPQRARVCLWHREGVRALQRDWRLVSAQYRNHGERIFPAERIARKSGDGKNHARTDRALFPGKIGG